MWAVFLFNQTAIFLQVIKSLGESLRKSAKPGAGPGYSFFSVTRAFNLTIDDSSLIVTELGHGLLAVSCEGLLISLLVIKFIAVCFVIEVKGRCGFSDYFNPLRNDKKRV